MIVNPDEISKVIKQQIESYTSELSFEEAVQSSRSATA